MKKHHIWYLIIGIFILIVPTVIYLFFLVPRLTEEYRILMASAGIVGGGGMYGAELIPEKIKFASMYKLAGKAFTLLTVTTIVEKFIIQLVGLAATIVVSYIVFYVLKEVWKNARRKLENEQLAGKIARSINETSK